MKPQAQEMFDSKKISIIEFREKLLMEELEKYRTAITGERESILPYIRDENGRYSESKTWEFIDELTEYAYRYEEYCKETIRNSCEENSWEAEEAEIYAGASEAFSEEEKEYIQSFLYCVIRIAESNPWRNTQGASQTFEDFIRFSEEHYEGLGQLYAAEAKAEACGDDYRDMKGICRPASWLTHLFTGKCLTAQYEDGIKKEFRGYISPIVRSALDDMDCEPYELLDRLIEKFGEDEPGDLYEEVCEELCGEEDLIREKAPCREWEETDELTEKQRAARDAERKRLEETRRLAQEEKERIKKEFCGKEQFVERYLTFKNYQYSPKYEEPSSFGMEDMRLLHLIRNLNGVVKGMVRLFTESRGLSRIQDNDFYFTATALLRQSGRKLQKMVPVKQEE